MIILVETIHESMIIFLTVYLMTPRALKDKFILLHLLMNQLETLVLPENKFYCFTVSKSKWMFLKPATHLKKISLVTWSWTYSYVPKSEICILETSPGYLFPARPGNFLLPKCSNSLILLFVPYVNGPSF